MAETSKETFQLQGGQVLDKVRQLIHEGNVRSIIIKNEKDEVLVELPLTVGVVGALFLPVWAAVGAIAALAANLTIVVEKVDRGPVL